MVLLWNARGCTRPSFVQHFTTLFDKFNPVLFVILEARIFSESTTYLMYDLPGSYEVCHCGPQRRPGGVLVLWKPSALMGNFLYTSDAPTGMVFDAVFKVMSCITYILNTSFVFQLQSYFASLLYHVLKFHNYLPTLLSNIEDENSTTHLIISVVDLLTQLLYYYNYNSINSIPFSELTSLNIPYCK